MPTTAKKVYEYSGRTFTGQPAVPSVRDLVSEEIDRSTKAARSDTLKAAVSYCMSAASMFTAVLIVDPENTAKRAFVLGITATAYYIGKHYRRSARRSREFAEFLRKGE